MKYTFDREGVPEDVALERWVWVARYKDGSTLHQFDGATGIFHQFGEIDLEKLQSFMMVSMVNGTVHEIAIREGMAPVHFYRNFRPAGSEVWQRYYCFGHREMIDGKISKTLFIIGLDNVLSPLEDDGR